MTKFLAPALLLVALALVAAGCGGGKSRNDAYAGSVSEFTAALNSICGPVRKQVRDLRLTSVEAIAERGDQLRTIIRETVDKIANLEPPDEVADAVDDFISVNREEEGKVGELVDAAKDRNAAKVGTLSREIQKLDDRSDAAAREIGAKRCASSSS